MPRVPYYDFLYDPESERELAEKRKVNICLREDQMYPDGGKVMSSCPVCKQQYLSIENVTALFCKVCGEPIVVEQIKSRRKPR